MHRKLLTIVFFPPLDIEKLCTFSQRFPLPSMYRALVWKVLLGMRPRVGNLSSKMFICHCISQEKGELLNIGPNLRRLRSCSLWLPLGGGFSGKTLNVTPEGQFINDRRESKVFSRDKVWGEHCTGRNNWTGLCCQLGNLEEDLARPHFLLNWLLGFSSQFIIPVISSHRCVLIRSPNEFNSSGEWLKRKRDLAQFGRKIYQVPQVTDVIPFSQSLFFFL